jgi:hypothetical protein
MEQLELAASVVPQALVPVAIAKSLGLVPASVMPVMFSVAVPVLDSVATCDALVVPVVDAKVSVGGVSVAAGAAAAVPVPLSAVVCGEPDALSATESVAEKVVAEAGVKVT